MNVKQLQALVKEKIVISEMGGTFYADVVEENGDEFQLARSKDIAELHDNLKAFGNLKEVN
jgi:hypothetical protein